MADLYSTGKRLSRGEWTRYQKKKNRRVGATFAAVVAAREIGLFEAGIIVAKEVCSRDKWLPKEMENTIVNNGGLLAAILFSPASVLIAYHAAGIMNRHLTRKYQL